MTIRGVRTGTWARLEGDYDREIAYGLLDRRYSYPVEGFYFSPAYRAGTWDGRSHLVRRLRGGGLTFPAGLFPEAMTLLRKAGYEVEVVEELPDPGDALLSRWTGHVLRDYQEKAVAAILTRGSGIIRLPVRGGKTTVAAAIAHRMRLRTLFVVTSDVLRRQAAAEFQASLPDAAVTQIGGGEWDETGNVVVATMQSLCIRLKTRTFQTFARSFPLVFMDECHHLSAGGEAWRDTALALNAPCKVGLSGTIEISRKTQNHSGAIWLRGICGPVVFSRTISNLVEAGYLTRPTVRFVRHHAPKMEARKWSTTTYKEGITECQPRNEAIVREAIRYANAGSRVLIDVARKGHTRRLAGMIRSLYPGTVAILMGDSPSAERDRVLRDLAAGTTRIVVGTILGEGVDVPALEIVINAEGGKAKVSTIQRLRNLTTAPGKTRAAIVEMVDDHDKHLRRWTLERLRIYRGEEAFRIAVDPREEKA